MFNDLNFACMIASIIGQREEKFAANLSRIYLRKKWNKLEATFMDNRYFVQSTIPASLPAE